MSLRASPLYSSFYELLYPILELFPRRLRNPYSKPTLARSNYSTSLYDAWLASRVISSNKGDYLSPGAHRSLSADNFRLALHISKRCAIDFFALLWSLHPFRILLMLSFDVLRGVFPAFRGYSQALIIDEVRHFSASHHSRILNYRLGCEVTNFDIDRKLYLDAASQAHLDGGLSNGIGERCRFLCVRD